MAPGLDIIVFRRVGDAIERVLGKASLKRENLGLDGNAVERLSTDSQKYSERRNGQCKGPEAGVAEACPEGPWAPMAPDFLLQRWQTGLPLSPLSWGAACMPAYLLAGVTINLPGLLTWVSAP